MEAVVVMMVVLGLCHGVETYCDGRQNGAQCYGALGGTVDVQLMDRASDIHKYQWIKDQRVILDGRKNQILFNHIENRSLFTPSNGTFSINNLSRNDGGEYQLDIYDANGYRSEERTLNLIIQGVETYCDGRQNEAQCYGALGGTVDVQLMDRASDVHKYQWIKDQRTILDGRKDQILTNLTDQRYFFTPSNGTFRINNLSRNDSGEYQLELYDSEGKNKKRTLHLTIQAPVGSVLLLSECLSEGQMRASCSSEGGDSPQYSWTLDGHTLTHAELLSGNNETNNITLKQHVSGRLLCSVRNQVNNVSKEETISPCKDQMDMKFKETKH
ncbi:T-cell surface antigen CD2-like isoform X2 [Betta splendens]|uniref:T-cell surface antigen CD2-like isoform X2 n=1 Tax=Betta splendens TaxID=158456 RepID=A0A9W2Y353_BETSP|nr:T-cell surface antigen CD2-like isoform X2 [Betta splendens]